MAIDESILTAHLAGSVPPTLRLYQFAPPAVSLGYAQSIDAALANKIKGQGFDLVRRPTGGRAVLHMGDLTYSFICSSKGAPVEKFVLVGESIAVAYKQICQALILALRSLGVEATIGPQKGKYKDKHDCFLSTTGADLQYQSHKLIGSAQLRRRHAVLQHGSLILEQPQSLMLELFNDKNGHSNNPHDHTHHANLNEITNQGYSTQTIIEAIIKGFELVFENQFVEDELTGLEQDLSKKLKHKYKNLIW